MINSLAADQTEEKGEEEQREEEVEKEREQAETVEEREEHVEEDVVNVDQVLQQVLNSKEMKECEESQEPDVSAK